jgi:hypothetical protein
VPKRRNESLDPELIKRLVRAIRKHPSLTDAADACGVHPRTLQLWIKRGLSPSPDAGCHALAVAARRSRALLRGKLFGHLVEGAKNDPKWAAYLLERMDEDGEITWESTVPGPGDQAVNLKQIMANPPPEVLAAIEAAGMKLVPLEPGDVQPLQITEGQFADDE